MIASASWFRFVVHTSLGDLLFWIFAGLLLFWFICAVLYNYLRGRI